MPKSAHSRSAQKASPSEHTTHNSRSVFGLTVLKNNHKDIRRLRREAGYPSHHGNKVWNSSLVLMDYFREHPLKKRKKVLEVGCGWGLAGIYCAKYFQSRVTGLDIDPSVFPFMQHHAAINQTKVDNVALSYERATREFLSGFDVLLGGDICFWDQLSRPLYNLIRRASSVGVEVVMSDPGRPPFTEMATKCVDKLDGEFDAWSVPAPYHCSGFILRVPPAA